MDFRLNQPETMDVKLRGKATGTQVITITPLKPGRTYLDAHLSGWLRRLAAVGGGARRRRVLTLKKPLQPSQVRTP